MPSTNPISQKPVNQEAPKAIPNKPTFLVPTTNAPRPLLEGEDNIFEKVAVWFAYFVVVITFPFSMCYLAVVVHQFERLVILRNGKVHKNRSFGPGIVYHLPFVDEKRFVDLRISCHAVPPQEVLTKDSLAVSVDAAVYYRIVNPVLALVNVTDYEVSTHYLASTTLRNSIGSKKLTEVLLDRIDVSHHVFEFMNNITKDWGIQIIRVEIKDISLPLQLQKAMAAEAESTRMANAKIIVAKAEIESTKSLQQATDILLDNPMCMQLRYLQSLQTISSEKTHTVVFPFTSGTLKNIL